MKILKAVISFIASCASLSAGSLTLSNFNISAFIGATEITGATSIAVRYGTYSSSTFTPLFGNTYNSGNSGYFNGADKELILTLNQSDNTLFTAGNQLYISVLNLSELSNYSSSSAQVILTDTSWLVPTFSLVSSNSINFTTNTSAVQGTYQYNAGSPVLGLTAVPEPATYAALFGVASLGVCVWRKRRKA